MDRLSLSCKALMALPRDWLSGVCRDFLTLREVVRLDWAMSERVGRARLLEVLGSGSVWYERGGSIKVG